MANLLSGTRIYGTANVDTQINVSTNLTINAISFAYVGNTTTSPTVTLANTGSLTIGNSTTTQTASIITVANSAGNVQITPGTASINATGSVNAASYNVGTIFIANTTALKQSTNTFTLGTASTTANGYTRLPNGLLMQWGTQTATVNSSTTATATFSIAFPTALYSFNGTLLQAGAGSDAFIANTANTTAVVWKNASAAGSASKQMYYIAIGN